MKAHPKYRLRPTPPILKMVMDTYWLYTPGYGAVKWEEFYKNGIMAIARDYLGDLSQYETKEAMRTRMTECGTDKGTSTYKNAALEAWQFAHEMQGGDIVLAKRGKRSLVGWGVVVSDYIYDENRPDEYKNIRKVKWFNQGEWTVECDLETKVLTNITPYPELVDYLWSSFSSEEDAFYNEALPPDCETNDPLTEYSANDFLSEVYLSVEQYNTLVSLLMKKKNIILQGAPGTGKTYAAERLAYSIIGSRNSEQVTIIQFHQSYSYEDFVMGYRPKPDGGFELKHGVFYELCKRAESDKDNKYFLIIDEINRGNLSKIFGELFVLLESDKRGKEVRLLYSDELFSVPANLYVIGMMNTADRSLAMMDYALRRRFSFFNMEPAFASAGFKKYLQAKNNPKLNALVAAVIRLNEAIAADDALGSGFCIGHSYFCAGNDEIIDNKWLEAVVDYEIIPLLNEYWFDEPQKVRSWADALRKAIA